MARKNPDEIRGIQGNRSVHYFHSINSSSVELMLQIYPVEAEKVRENMSRCLGLIQGLLLLHRPSQRLFARKSSLEVGRGPAKTILQS